MQQKPIRPALAAARIWSMTSLLGSAFYVLFIKLYQSQGSSLPILQASEPNFFRLYSTLLLVGLTLFIVPFFITWAMLAFWKKKRLLPYMMSERFLLLNVLLTVFGIIFLMNNIGTQHPLTHAAMLLLPYSLGAVSGILLALGWPFRKKMTAER